MSFLPSLVTANEVWSRKSKNHWKWNNINGVAGRTPFIMRWNCYFHSGYCRCHGLTKKWNALNHTDKISGPAANVHSDSDNWIAVNHIWVLLIVICNYATFFFFFKERNVVRKLQILGDLSVLFAGHFLLVKNENLKGTALTWWSWRSSADGEHAGRWCRKRCQVWRSPTAPQRCCQQWPK